MCGWDEVFILAVGEDPAPAHRKVWSWRAADSPGIPADMHALFRTTDDCKPVDGGRRILISSSGGGVALVDRETRRASFSARVTNAHSIEMLPGERIAAAASVSNAGTGNPLRDLRRRDRQGVRERRASLGARRGVGRCARRAVGARRRRRAAWRATCCARAVRMNRSARGDRRRRWGCPDWHRQHRAAELPRLEGAARRVRGGRRLRDGIVHAQEPGRAPRSFGSARPAKLFDVLRTPRCWAAASAGARRWPASFGGDRRRLLAARARSTMPSARAFKSYHIAACPDRLRVSGLPRAAELGPLDVRPRSGSATGRCVCPASISTRRAGYRGRTDEQIASRSRPGIRSGTRIAASASGLSTITSSETAHGRGC